MILLYVLFTWLLYACWFPVSRLGALLGSEISRGRLGLIPQRHVDLWIHAASVGEVKVVGTLIAYLLDSRPGLKIHVTVLTPHGMQSAASTLPASVTRSYFPFDAVPSVRRTLSRLRPRMILIAETEIWPNLIREASRRDIPLVMVNGRLSARSSKRYGLVRRSMIRLLDRYDRFLMKTEQDRDRLAHFVPAGDKLEVVGDMKFDAPLLERSDERVAQLRGEMGVAEDEFLFVAGSTRPGEEAALVRAYREVKVTHRHVRLLLAPRHLERLEEIAGLLAGSGCEYYFYGQAPRPSQDVARRGGVIVLDCMGVLNNLYLAADLAFVGGTLVDIGGHNILEPVWARTPVVYGPYLSNVIEAADYIERHKYGMRLDSSDTLRAVLADIVSGRRTFNTKTDTDDLCSATAVTCTYVLERLGHA